MRDEDDCGIPHDFLSDFEDLVGHGGGKQPALRVAGDQLEDLSDLLAEIPLKHLIGFVEDEQFQFIHGDPLALQQIHKPPGSPYDDLRRFHRLEDLLLLGETRPANGLINAHSEELGQT